MDQLPNPGEVWICVEPYWTRVKPYGDDIKNRIAWGLAKDEVFIVTCITQQKVGFVKAGGEPLGESGWIQRSDGWKWHEHFVRIYPPVPTWEELEASRNKVERHDDDLRSKALSGSA